ncbi:hypothetical protein J2Z34_003166 [Youngiibacter multivorans]|uniref:Uncharacterized protein n=1 Tax=Youngiibacter multivorans TaxID=937251 RepID=A0ABS4G7Y9_9CLOT|nr:hypothetical protein [Youngiibacter multivorans]
MPVHYLPSLLLIFNTGLMHLMKNNPKAKSENIFTKPSELLMGLSKGWVLTLGLEIYKQSSPYMKIRYAYAVVKNTVHIKKN